MKVDETTGEAAAATAAVGGCSDTVLGSGGGSVGCGEGEDQLFISVVGAGALEPPPPLPLPLPPSPANPHICKLDVSTTSDIDCHNRRTFAVSVIHVACA